MKKKLLAVAIAGAVASPFALADSGNVTISGNLEASITSEKKNNGNKVSDVGPGGSDMTIAGSEELGNGLKAVFLLKTWVNVTGNAGGGSNNAALFGQNKDAYLGLAGSFGTVALGAHGQPFKTATGGLELFGDTIGDARGTVTNGQGTFHSGITDAVIWFLPNYNGVSGHLQWGASNGGAAGSNPNAWGAQFNYSNGPLYATYAYANNDGATTATDESGHKVGVGYSFGDTTINAVYENTEVEDATVSDISAYSVGLAQKFGANTFKIQYAANDNDAAGTATDDQSLWAVGLDHNMSKRTKLFALYADGDKLGTTAFDNGIEVGMAHSF